MNMNTISTVALASFLVLGTVGQASAQLTPGFDPDADYCHYEADYSWYQRYETSAPEAWGAMIFEWRLTADGTHDAGEVTSWEWYNASNVLYSQLDTAHGHAPLMAYDGALSAAWRLTINVTPYVGNSVAAELRSIGGTDSTQWIFGGAWMQTGARPFTSIGAISCGYDP